MIRFKGVHSFYKQLQKLILLATLPCSFLITCGPLPKESEFSWVLFDLRLQPGNPSPSKRSGTGGRGSEFAIAVPEKIEFSEKGPEYNSALSWNKVNTSNNIVSLRLPTNEPLKIFVYRYAVNHQQIELEQRLYLRELDDLDLIDFGQSDVFSIRDSGNSLWIDGKNSSILNIQLARQLFGKLAQNYVTGAQVWADRIDADGSFNQLLDADENTTISGPDGSYFLSPDYINYILITEGGFKLNASAAYVRAAPMLATVPDGGQTEVHITPLTTLAAVAPELENIFAESGDWRADMASSTGVSSDLLRVAKVAESFWMLLSGGSNPIAETTQQQLNALSILAQKFAQGSRVNFSGDLSSLVDQAVYETLNNPEISRELSEDSKTIFSLQMTNLTTRLSELLPNNDRVIEDDLLSEFDLLNEQAFSSLQTVLCEFPEGVSVQFDPIILSISLVSGSDNTIEVRGTVSDEDFSALSAYWAIDPPEELRESVDPVLVNATINESGYVETTLNVDNWDHFGSVSLQLTECSPVKVITESCTWVSDSVQVNCNFME